MAIVVTRVWAIPPKQGSLTKSQDYLWKPMGPMGLRWFKQPSKCCKNPFVREFPFPLRPSLCYSICWMPHLVVSIGVIFLLAPVLSIFHIKHRRPGWKAERDVSSCSSNSSAGRIQSWNACREMSLRFGVHDFHIRSSAFCQQLFFAFDND